MEEPGFSWTALKLVLIISLIFLLQQIFPNQFELLALNSQEVLYRPWTLVTYIFLHANYSHLFSNMFFLVIAGLMLEKTVGYKNFLFVFFITGIFSGIVSTFFYDSVIGASGAIYGVMSVLAVIRSKTVIYVLGVPMYIIIAMILYAILDLGGVFYPSSTANIGHLSALFFGVVIGLYWRKKYKITEKKKEKIKIDEEYFREWEEKYMKRN
ncbi:MAG TPA: rhomboid family intramembrane serine protease [archaeon]|nr:rhomboid family intramembrane serine protease [archaeon]